MLEMVAANTIMLVSLPKRSILFSSIDSLIPLPSSFRFRRILVEADALAVGKFPREVFCNEPPHNS